MSRLNKILLGIVIVLALALAISWNKLGSSISDWKASEFATYSELQTSGLSEQGWLPKWMPSSATQIKETHNLDTGAGYLFFHFSEADLNRLSAVCPQIIKPLPELPKHLSADWLPKKPDHYFLCEQGKMAMDSTQLTVLIWR